MSVATIAGGPHGTLRFRTDPNLCEWNYKLNTQTTNTYGGKVIQLLSVSIDTMQIQFEAGVGGPDYLRYIALQFRDIILFHRNTGKTVQFSYPPRNWVFNVFVQQFTWQDQFANVLFPYAIACKVQEDVTGVVTSKTLSAALSSLQDGIGYVDNGFNDPMKVGTGAKPATPPESLKVPSPQG